MRKSVFGRCAVTLSLPQVPSYRACGGADVSGKPDTPLVCHSRQDATPPYESSAPAMADILARAVEFGHGCAVEVSRYVVGVGQPLPAARDHISDRGEARCRR